MHHGHLAHRCGNRALHGEIRVRSPRRSSGSSSHRRRCSDKRCTSPPDPRDARGEPKEARPTNGWAKVLLAARETCATGAGREPEGPSCRHACNAPTQVRNPRAHHAGARQANARGLHPGSHLPGITPSGHENSACRTRFVRARVKARIKLIVFVSRGQPRRPGENPPEGCASQGAGGKDASFLGGAVCS